MKITLQIPKSAHMLRADAEQNALIMAAQMFREQFRVAWALDGKDSHTFSLESVAVVEARAGLWSRLCAVLAEIKVRLSWN